MKRLIDVPISHCAVLVIDMWDKHWCTTFTEQLKSLVPSVNTFVTQMRELGLTIVHAPFGVTGFYVNHPAYQNCIALAKEGVDITTPTARIPSLQSAKYPTKRGPCSCGCKLDSVWTRQHEGIEIADIDFLSDNWQLLYQIFQRLEIEVILTVGVALNCCVLSRGFGLVNFNHLGFTDILVQDLTDVVVNGTLTLHDKGMAAWVDYVEKHIAVTTTTNDILMSTVVSDELLIRADGEAACNTNKHVIIWRAQKPTKLIKPKTKVVVTPVSEVVIESVPEVKIKIIREATANSTFKVKPKITSVPKRKPRVISISKHKPKPKLGRLGRAILRARRKLHGK